MKRQKAFTLIELLVVISIIALLLAILFPALQRVRRQAKALGCQSNLRQWGKTLAIYTQDNEGRLPWGDSGCLWFLRGAFLSTNDPNQPDDSLHHFRTRGIVCCPMASKPDRKIEWLAVDFDGVSGRVEGTPGSTFGAWEITKPGPAFHGSCGFNAWLFSGFAISGRPVEYERLDILSLKDQAGIPTLLDSAQPCAWPRQFDLPPRRQWAGLGMTGFVINRHEGHVNGLFLDWSVRKVGLKELWTLKWHKNFDTAGPWTKAGGAQPQDWPEWMRQFKDY